MERFFAASQNSPLQMLRMLENNLKRERRIFAMAVGLLIFVAICAAGATAVFMFSSVLRAEQELVQAAMRGVNVSIFSRYNMLNTGAALLEAGAGPSKANEAGVSGKPSCQAYPVDRADPVLLAACNAARQMIPEESTPPILQYVSFDGSVSHGFSFFVDVDDRVPPAERLAALAGFAKIYMNTHGIKPLDAAQARRVMWFVAPPSIGFRKPTIMMFMVVARDEAPVGFVFTRINLDRALRYVMAESLGSQIAIFGEDGRVLGGDDTEYTQYVNRSLASAQPGTFHWLPGRGWGARLDPLALGVGHITAALPLNKELALKRVDLSIIALVTGVLVAMLFAMYRYWNFRFLTPNYEQARRAVEREILNHLLVHATPVGLCIALRTDFGVIAANQVASSMLGLSDVSMRLPAGLCEALEANGIAPADKGHETMIRQLQYSLAKPDDGVLHLKISYASAVVNNTDVLFCAIADISEHHEVERLLRAAKETSDAAAKAKLSFFASMSHEIRTPLSSLVGNLELVALGPLAAEQEARVHAMQASANALLQVVNDVLDFSKMDIGEMRLFQEWGSIHDLVVRVMIAHAPLANRQGLRLFVVIDRSCPAKLLFDPIRVSQILNNLLGNALKFTYSGKVVVRACWVDGALELSVADSGVGIPDSQRETLFQPFIQGEAHRLTQSRGTGLGLSICVRLCQLMKGRISLDSTEGVGTRIRVSLPLAVETPGVASDAFMLGGRPAILCRASEYREWFENLYDPDRSVLTFLSQASMASTDGCDYLIATDEFTDQEIESVWTDQTRTIRMTQNGPLVPVHWGDGVLEVSIFSVKGFKDAVGIINGRDRATARPNAASAPAVRAARNSGPTVVIAEDNRLNRGLLRDQLLTLGATVLEAADGEEALELLRKNRVDIVLTDMDMPKMSGAELLAAARARDPSMRIYAVSASASTQDVEAGRARGFTDYLTKPLPLSVLAGVLQAASAKEADDASDANPRAAAVDDSLPSRFPTVPASYMPDLLAQIEEDIAALDGICRAKDMEQLRAWTHKQAGGLAVLGPSTMYDQCEELRTVLRESEDWEEDVDTFTALLRVDLIDLRGLLRAAQETPHK